MTPAPNTGLPATAMTVQILVAVILLAPIPVVAVFAFVPSMEALGVLYVPALWAGVLAPIVAYFAYWKLIGNAIAGADADQRAQRFMMAHIVPLALTESVALIGAMAFSADKRLLALLPVATHLLLGFFIWPATRRFDIIREGKPPREGSSLH